MSTGNLYHGIVHGRIIELDSDPQLSDGEKVTLEIRAPSQDRIEVQRAAIRRAAWAWKDVPGIDEWLTETFAVRLSDPRWGMLA